MRINKEGFSTILISLLAAVAVSIISFLFVHVWLGCLVTLALLVLLFFIVFFFREPNRPLLTDDKLVYAPADGKIVVVEHTSDPEYLEGERIQVSVFMSLTNVHVNWFPVRGTVEYVKYHPGKYHAAWNPKSSTNNERMTVVVNTGKHTILFRQIAGLLARRIVSYAVEGSRVGQNEKSGFIKFGSRVDVLLPPDAEILVGLNDKVVGSQTPIARLR